MIVSDLASPAEVITRHDEQLLCFAQAGNRLPLFGIMRYSTAIIGGFDDCGRRTAGLKSELFGGFIGDRSGHDEG